MGFREHTLFWSACALAVASFAYGTYVLIAWSPAFASPSDLPRVACCTRLLCRLSIVDTYGVPRLQELTGESQAQGCNFTVMHGN